MPGVSVPPGTSGRVRRRIARPVNRIAVRLFGYDDALLRPDVRRRRLGDVVYWTVVGTAVVYGTGKLLAYVTAEDGWAVFWTPLWQGLITFGRVTVLLAVATVVWVPIGVRIGLDPRAARIAQPLVQILASFPANLLFPFAVWAFVTTGLSLNIGGILLMSLGAQCYILNATSS
jgi:NitT/TauT family transport system permease protein